MDQPAQEPTSETPDYSVPMALELQKKQKGGANWFYWIAGLSVINSALILFGAEITFVVGLGMTQIVDGIALAVATEIPEAAVAFRIFAIVLNLIIAGMFVGFAFFANKGHRWAYIIGMIIYAFDALIFLALGDVFSLAFHGLALFFVFQGMRALGQLKALASASAPPAPVPAAEEIS